MSNILFSSCVNAARFGNNSQPWIQFLIDKRNTIRHNSKHTRISVRSRLACKREWRSHVFKRSCIINMVQDGEALGVLFSGSEAVSCLQLLGPIPLKGSI